MSLTTFVTQPIKSTMNTINEYSFSIPKSKICIQRQRFEKFIISMINYLVMIASDRLSAFDVIMPRQIPFKGQILNQIATKMMKETEDLSS